MSYGVLTWMTRLAVTLAFTVVVLGAYVRLSHAGLGCPDWPGCYGQMIVPDQVAPDVESQHQRPLEHGKAWKEMIHRYAAGTLGLLIAGLAVISWKNRKQPGQPLLLPGMLAMLVVFQAALGMWTVTLLLKPVIVVAHLLGGMAILSLLYWLLLERTAGNTHRSPALLPWAVAALVMLVLQISLGGWTSANYAALACPDFPACQGQWWPPMDFASGFTLWHKPGMDYEGGILAGDARAAIHMAHRLGALFSFLIIGATALRTLLDGNKPVGRLGILMLGALVVQLLLGISNVLLRLPLPVAVAHNAVAALLLLALVALLHKSISPGNYRRTA